jgi:PIN domain nuclease of toxin-antitoxin system
MVVLDDSALLAYLFAESGHEMVVFAGGFEHANTILVADASAALNHP